MGLRARFSRTTVVVGAACALTGAVAGGAIAAGAVGSDGTITGCYSRGNGALRVVADASVPRGRDGSDVEPEGSPG